MWYLPLPISSIWYSDNNARKRLRGGKIGGGCACVLAWRVKARLLTVARGLTRNDCHLVAPLAVAPIRHVGNEPCFVFFWKESTGRRHVMSPYLPSMHCTDGDAACTNQDFISLIASAYLPISYTSHESRGRPDGRCPACLPDPAVAGEKHHHHHHRHRPKQRPIPHDSGSGTSLLALSG